MATREERDDSLSRPNAVPDPLETDQFYYYVKRPRKRYRWRQSRPAIAPERAAQLRKSIRSLRRMAEMPAEAPRSRTPAEIRRALNRKLEALARGKTELYKELEEVVATERCVFRISRAAAPFWVPDSRGLCWLPTAFYPRHGGIFTTGVLVCFCRAMVGNMASVGFFWSSLPGGPRVTALQNTALCPFLLNTGKCKQSGRDFCKCACCAAEGRP